MNQNSNDYSHLYGMPKNPYDQPEPPQGQPDYGQLYGQPQQENPEPVNLSKEPEEAPQVFRLSPDIPQQTVYTAPPVQVKKPFSPIPLLLFAGVGFLFLGGIIFLTSTWEMLPNPARAIALLSASAIAFGANRLAEQVLKLPKTGLAFYVLGCIFLPLALGGIGVFELLGEWFSFHGNGSGLLWTVIFLCVSGTSHLGKRNYKSRFLAWLTLAGIGGAWSSFAYFLTYQLFGTNLSSNIEMIPFGALLVLFAVGATVWSEWYLRNRSETLTASVVILFLYPLLSMYSFFLMAMVGEYKLAGGILAVILGALFVNYRFITGKFHAGVLGVTFNLLAVGRAILYAETFHNVEDYRKVICITTFAALALLSVVNIPAAREELRKTFRITGYLMSIPMLCVGGLLMVTAIEAGGYLFFLAALLFIALICFVKTDKLPLPDSALPLSMELMLLFIAAICGTADEGAPFLLLLVLAALFLLVQAFLSRKIWPLALAVGCCLAVLLLQLPHPESWIYWLCAVAFLAGTVYAHIRWRFFLEKCFAWLSLSFLLTAFVYTLMLTRLGSNAAWMLLLALTALLYLLESVFLWQHLRTMATRPFLEVASILISFMAFIAYLDDERFSLVWGLLLAVILLSFSGVMTAKKNNLAALPQLLLFYFTAHHLILEYTAEHVSVQVILFLIVLGLLAAMGRLLLPQFLNLEDGAVQIDLPLLTGVLAVFSAAIKVDWYASILICLFLSIYSLLYIGRVKNRYVPALLASAFGCMTIFFHNVHDPFQILRAFRMGDIRTPQVLLYLLPMHLFILSLLWILPKENRSSVHKVRFGMYCITMLCLLVTSLGFGNATDAILLMVFSFGILLGSFAVKKLRWFTLGFAVLVVMTFRLTWKFWTSLHWGIYLFLAGIVLIGLASAYEYSARYAAEHPDEPKKKFRLFETWTW